MRRSFILSMIAALGPLWGASALADQYDPSLEKLFVDLRTGADDPDVLAAEIETRWVSAPEAGVQILVSRLIESLEADDVATASILADHITGLAPSFAEGWVLRGHTAAMAEDFGRAEAYYDRAVALEPRHYNALSALGDLAQMAGRKDDAFRFYREALDINPNLAETREKADQLRFELNGREI